LVRLKLPIPLYFETIGRTKTRSVGQEWVSLRERSDYIIGRRSSSSFCFLLFKKWT